MKKYRDLLFYIIVLAVFTALVYFVLSAGKNKELLDVTVITEHKPSQPFSDFTRTLENNLHHPLAILLLQIVTIIVAARIFGLLFKMLKQPTVIGEIIAGIFLGPSVVGYFFPEFSLFLFPLESLPNLQFLSQIGLILFMFVVGMELDLDVLKNKARDAVIISHASIVFPFSLGIGLSYFIYDGFAPQGVSFLAFSLFIGISLSITAFPVLARIVQEKGLSKTKVGTIAITCAAADDITAWCLLAAVIAIVKAGSVLSALYIILLAGLYVVVLLKLVKPFLHRVGEKYTNRETLSKPVVAVFFVTLLFSTYLSETIGIHALFGAFMAGTIMPGNIRFRNIFIEKVEDISLVLLLPLFFVFTGLRTEIGLLNTAVLWQVCTIITLLAVAGKFFGSALAARFVGQNWRDSLTIGALMNTRGLMELVVLNIGYDLGVLGPEIFAMMVLMALITTFMTSPALELINKKFTLPEENIQASTQQAELFNILIAFGGAQKGLSLFRLAYCFVKNQMQSSGITAMHLSPSNEINQYNFLEYEQESFAPIKAESEKLQVPLNLFFKPSGDIVGEIVDTSAQGNFDLLLIGTGTSVFEGSTLGRILGFGTRMFNPRKLAAALRGEPAFGNAYGFDEKANNILLKSEITVGVLAGKEVSSVKETRLMFSDVNDLDLLNLAEKLISNNGSRIILCFNADFSEPPASVRDAVQAVQFRWPLHFSTEQLEHNNKFETLEDLILISLSGWKNLREHQRSLFISKTSVLIVRS